MQKEIQLTDKTLLVVSVPEGARSFKVCSFANDGSKELFYNSTFMGFPNVRGFTNLGKFDWQLLGIYPELTEEQAKMVVDLPQYEHYFNYSYKNAAFKWLRTAKESFQSLMERENITGFEKYAILIKSK